MTASAEILAREARHAVGLARRQAGVEREALDDHDEITDLLVAIIATLGTSLSRRSFEEVLSEAYQLNREVSREASDRLEAAIAATLFYEAGFQDRIARLSAPDRTWAGAFGDALDAATPEVAGLLVMERRLRDWLRSAELKRYDELAQALGRELLSPEGATLAKIVDATAEALRGFRHEIAALAGAGHSSAVAEGWDAFWAANENQVAAWRWSSVVDTRVTPHICLPRDGKLYDREKQPIDHALPWGPGPGKIHFKCRSIGVPILTGEPMPQRFTVQDWLRSRPVEDVELVFGKQRARLWLSGELSAEDMVRPDGKAYTLRELELFDDADSPRAAGG